MKQDLELLVKRTVFKGSYTIGTLGYTCYDEHNNIIYKVPFLCNTLETKDTIAEGKYKLIINRSYKSNFRYY
jgi:hypothetical protein